MSAAGNRRSERIPPEWVKLERAAERAGILLGRWVRRAHEAEAEVERLRQALEDLAGERSTSDDQAQQVRRLKAENAALHSRMLLARKRISALMQRLAALDLEP